jgi:hypothetical protein
MFEHTIKLKVKFNPIQKLIKINNNNNNFAIALVCEGDDE